MKWIFDPHAVYSPPEKFKDKISVDVSKLTHDRKYYERIGSKHDHGPATLHEAGPTFNEHELRYLKDLYLKEIESVDERVGFILKVLDSKMLRDKTIIVFTSDHGNCLGCHNQVSKNVHYEESMRVPFLIRWTGTLPHRTDDLLLSTPDIFPTLMGLMGFYSDVPADVEGVSHAPLLLNGTGPRPTSQLYLWTPLGTPGLGRRGVRTHTHTMVVCRSESAPPHYVLHDNVNDPFQLQNVAAEFPETVQELIESDLNPWLERNRDPWLAA